jgi:hypothetical protein
MDNFRVAGKWELVRPLVTALLSLAPNERDLGTGKLRGALSIV